MELVVSLLGILLCWKDRKRLRFFLIAFVVMLISTVYMLSLVRGGVLENLHEMGYDTMSGLFRVLIYWIPLMMNIGFYGFLLLGIARLRSDNCE
jgi:ABC-type multidrug transport system permease subunit